jgi:hypothetical protein
MTVAVDAPFDLPAVWRRLRVPLVLTVVFVAIAILLAVTSTTAARRPLDPTDASPHGGLAVDRLVTARGVGVTAVADAASARADSVRAEGAPTVFVVDPASVTTSDLTSLASSAAITVVVAPHIRELDAMHLTARVVDDVTDATPDPACGLAAAAVAGDVHFSGVLYADRADDSCYPVDDGAGLLVHRNAAGGAVVVWGSTETFSNDHLATRGDAALAMGLLSQRPHLFWVLPHNPTEPASDASHKGLHDLLPSRLLWALLQLVVAVVVLALWRARRLGPVVVEPLPVVVRAAETVEGRARLLQAARARDTAAGALREASRARLGEMLALGAGADRAAVVEATAGRAGRSAAEVDRLLYGAEPTDDAALVALAAQLDDLEQAVRNS